MAVSSSVNYRSGDVVEIDVTATADGDLTTGNIPHGLGPTRPQCFLTSLLNYTGQGIVGGAVWIVAALDGVNVAITKVSLAGSGQATPQIRITLLRRR